MMSFDELLWKEPWLAPIIINLKNRIPTTKIKTVAVTADGRTVYYNPNFWDCLREKDKVGVQLHEILHIANMHIKRKGERDMELWNIACDMAINHLITAAGYSLPRLALDGVNDSAENIYDVIQNIFDDVKQYGFTDLLDNGILLRKNNSEFNIRRALLTDDLLEQDNAFSESEMSKTIEAIETTKSLAGKGVTWLSKQFKPTTSKTDWRVILQSLVKSISGDDVDYLTYAFDEFGICEDVLTPKPKTKICALVDESGSISDELYSKFLGELHKMSKWAEVFASGFTYDTSLNAVPLSKYKRTMTGGTCVLRAYKDAIKAGFDNIIVLTDGYLEFPREEPKPTIWVMPASLGKKNEVIIT